MNIKVTRTTSMILKHGPSPECIAIDFEGVEPTLILTPQEAFQLWTKLGQVNLRPATKMTAKRQKELESDAVAKLTREEMKEGWHFCIEFDDGLTQGEQLTDEGACAWCGFDGNKVK